MKKVLQEILKEDEVKGVTNYDTRIAEDNNIFRILVSIIGKIKVDYVDI